MTETRLVPANAVNRVTETPRYVVTRSRDAVGQDTPTWA